MVNYGTIYTLPFKSRKEVSYIVEIQKENYSGRSIELKGSGEAPFTVEINDEDFLYTPTRFSSATIRVVGNDYLQSLYSTGYQQYRVNFKRGDKIVWTGFVSPELYTQDYTSTLFELELQCVSAMSTLEYVNYKQKNEGGKVFVSLWDLLTRCVAESRGTYSAVYIPHVYARSRADYNTSSNILIDMTVSEQNFFDEDDKAMTLKEVVEEICKLFSWNCVDWMGELYFIDPDHRGEYRKYTPDFSSFTKVYPSTVNVQSIGFSGSEHVLDILGGYNRASVKTSNYCVDQAFPDEKFDKLKKLALPSDLKEGDKVCRMELLIPNEIKMKQYMLIDGNLAIIDDLNYYKDNASGALSLIGAIPAKYCVYKVKNGNPDITDYNYINIARVNQNGTGQSTPTINGEDNIPLIVVSVPPASYSQCALSISGALKIFAKSYTLSPFSNNILFASDWLYMSLRIGEMYYNGTGWVRDSSTRFHPVYADSVNDQTGGEEHGFTDFKDTKVLSMPFNGMNGNIIQIDDQIDGDLELTVYGVRNRSKNPTFQGSGGAMLQQYGHISGFFLKDFKLNYQKKDGIADDLEDSSDRFYENVVNESYINELDEIEFKISSYNDDGACYSKVMLGDSYLRDNLFSDVGGVLIRPEEHLISRIVGQYSATKTKLTQVLMYSESLTPLTALTDKFMPGKRFIITGGEIDYSSNQFNCKMIENGRN